MKGIINIFITLVIKGLHSLACSGSLVRKEVSVGTFPLLIRRSSWDSVEDVLIFQVLKYA